MLLLLTSCDGSFNSGLVSGLVSQFQTDEEDEGGEAEDEDWYPGMEDRSSPLLTMDVIEGKANPLALPGAPQSTEPHWGGRENCD